MTTEYRRGVLAAFAAVNDLGPRKFIDRDAWVNLNNARGAIRALLDQKPAHVDPNPTIAPGVVRLCDNCGLPCRPNPDGLCDGCHDDADAGDDGPEDICGVDPWSVDE